MDGNWKRLKQGSGLCFCKSEAGMTEVGRQGGKSSGTNEHKSKAPAVHGDRPTGHQEGLPLGFLMKKYEGACRVGTGVGDRG